MSNMWYRGFRHVGLRVCGTALGFISCSEAAFTSCSFGASSPACAYAEPALVLRQNYSHYFTVMVWCRCPVYPAVELKLTRCSLAQQRRTQQS